MKTSSNNLFSEWMVCAGGLVVAQRKVLLIYKSNVWDLPKGKIHRKESQQQAALREVSEETNLNINRLHIQANLPTTQYIKTVGTFRIHKTVHWYEMSYDGSLEDVKGLEEENIQGVIWVDFDQIKNFLPQAKPSITYLLDYFRQVKRI